MQEIFIAGTHIQYRILGDNRSKERIGAGFIGKRPGVDFQDISPSDFSIVYLLSGNGKYIDHKGRVYSIKSGSYFLRIPDYRHTSIIEAGTDWQEFFLAFGPQQCKAFIDMGFVDPDELVGFIGNQPALVEQVWELHQRLQKAENIEIPYIFRSMSGILFDMLATGRINEKTSEKVVLVEKICDYLINHLDERITIDQLSHKFGISNSKLRKDFKQIKGVSAGSYLIRKRIEESFKYLSDSSMSIGEIAGKLGYNSIYDYSNQFRKLTGHSPSFFRRKS